MTQQQQVHNFAQVAGESLAQKSERERRRQASIKADERHCRRWEQDERVQELNNQMEYA